MNILNYTLRLNDQMSSTLSRVGASSDNAREEVRDLRNEVEKLDKTTVSGITNSMSGLVKIASALGIGTLVGRGLGKAITDGMDMEIQHVSFDVLFGGADKAKEMIDQITDYSSKAFGSTVVSNAVQMMKGFDIASDEIMTNIKSIGDIAMGNTDKFNSLSLAFSQMSSTGQLMGQDLLQMINAGFNPLVQMSKTTGKSVATLKDEMSKGLITSQMVKQAFYDAAGAGGQYNGMIEKMASTTKGQVDQAFNIITNRLINLYDKYLQPIIFPALQVLNKLLFDPIETVKGLANAFTTKFPVISGVIIGLTAAITAYKIVTGIVTFVTGAWTAAQWLLNVSLTANPVGLIIAGVVALIAVISFLILKIDGWGNAWTHTVTGAKLIFKAYVESVKFYFNTMIDGIMLGLNIIKEGWYEFKEAVGIGDSSENQKMLQQIHADTEARKKAIVDGAKDIANLGIEAANEFKLAAGSFSWNDTSFSDVLGGFKDQIGISSPGVPRMTTSGGAATETSTGGKGSKDAANAIATGGSKTTHIYVTVGEMGSNMKIYVNDLKEGAENIRDIVLDQLTRALTMAQGQI